MSAPLSPRFNAFYPWHRTRDQWISVGPSDRWYLNAFLFAMVHTEAVCLLPSGAVVRFFVNDEHKVDCEVTLADTEVQP